MRIYGDPKHKLGVFYWRSEADFGRRMAVVAYDVLTQATAKIKGGLLITGTKARASLRSPRLFVLVAPASSKLERPHGAQKTPSGCLGLLVDGGPKRIRTAVAAFAELSLATRPSDPQNRRWRRVGKYTKTNGPRLHLKRAKCTFAP